MNGKSQKILVIDDNAPFRALMAAFLEKAGYIPLQAESGARALDILQSEKPSLLLVDLQMDNLGGFDFIRECYNRGIDIPAVMVTGDTGADVWDRASRLGFAGLLKKPVNEDRLLKAVAHFAR